MADPKKTDPKEDRIAELEFQVEFLTGEQKKGEDALRQLEELRGEIAKRDANIKALGALLEAEKASAAELREKLTKDDKSTVSGLPEGAVQLSKSLVVPGLDNQRLNLISGDVVLLSDVKTANAVQAKLGSEARVYAVPKSTMDEILKLGAARGR